MVRRRPEVDVDAVRDDAFALADDLPPFASAWHSHKKHQILYAATGTAVLSTKGARWLLPPQRAAWIGANTPHRVTSTTGIALRTIYLGSSLVAAMPTPCGVFTVTPLAREMMLFAMRWSANGEADRTRSAFFVAFAGLCAEWLKSDSADSALLLPEAETRELRRAMAYVADNLVDATMESAAAAAHVSVRTLARRFEDEARMSFRAYLQTVRLVKAVELLAMPTASVSATAYAVGFRSPGAFTTAFTARCGETPSAFHRRATGKGQTGPR